MRKIFRRLHYLLNRRQAERDLADEISAHREMMDRDRIPSFGSGLRLIEESRDAWGFNWLDHAIQDLRISFRTLRRFPGFTLISTLILTLGIGLNLALFQLVNVTFLKPLPVKDPGTLVRFYHRSDGSDGNITSSGLSSAAAQFFRSNNTILSATLTQVRTDVAWYDDPSDRLRAAFVSSNWFDELGYTAARGRVFQERLDDAVDAPPMVVVSYNFWRTRLREDTGIIGATVRVNNRPVTIIGVAPANFPGLRFEDTQLWLLAAQGEYFHLATSFVELYGRVRQGLTASAVREGTRSPMREIVKLSLAYGSNPWLEPYYAAARFEPPQDVRTRWNLTALVGGLTLMVLLVACANLSNLILSRALGRLRELSVRAALGATRWRIMRQLLTECLLLALLGAVGGIVLGHWAATTLAAIIALPSYLDFTLDWRTTLAAIGLATFAMIAIGLAPAWKVSRHDLAGSMKDGGQQASAAFQRTGLRQGLVTIQVAGSCLLLIVAGLMVQSLREVLRAGPGFDFRNVAVMNATMYPYGTTAAKARAFWSEVTRTIVALAEVEKVALVSSPPLGDVSGTSTFRDAPGLKINNISVSPNFFSLMKIPILKGRGFEAADGRNGTIISARLALAVYGTLDVVGRAFPRARGPAIVGVAGDAKLSKLQAPDVAEQYRLLDPATMESQQLLVRARTDAKPLLAPLRQATRAVDDRVLTDVRLMESDFESKLRGPRLARSIAGSMALLSLTLACLGVFGVVSHGAAMRTKEIGIRMALGGSRRAIVGMLVRQLAWPMSIGLALGAAAAVPITILLSGEPLYLKAVNASVLAVVAVFLFVSAGAAALAPALRALRADPVEALRYD